MGIPFLDLTNDQLFPLTNICLPVWILLGLLPKWKYTFPIVTIVTLFFSVLYLLLMIDISIFSPIDSSVSDFGSLDGLLKLFSFKSAVFAGWVHYVAFDLWTGMWIANDSNISGFPQLLLIPCLFLTLMAGPVGLMTYLGLKTVFGYKIKEKSA